MTRTLLVALVLLLIAAPLAAQTPDSYSAKYYAVGATVPVQTETFLPTAAICNQAAPTIANTVNPTRVVWDDPAVLGKVCIYTGSPTGPLFSMPAGNYEATLAAINAAGSSPESARSPFSRLAVLAAPTNVKAIR